MNRMKLFFILLFTYPLLLFCQERIPKEQYFQKLKELWFSINILSDAPPGTFRANIEGCKEVVGKAIQLESSFSGDFTTKHISSINYLIDFCSQLRKSDIVNKETMSAILKKDIYLKFVDEERSKMIASIEVFVFVSNKLVPVVVETKKNNSAVNNLRVKWSALGFYTDFDKPNGAFGQLTSPSSDEMVPGIYIIWVTQDGDPKVLNKLDFEVNPFKRNMIGFAIQ